MAASAAPIAEAVGVSACKPRQDLLEPEKEESSFDEGRWSSHSSQNLRRQIQELHGNHRLLTTQVAALAEALTRYNQSSAGSEQGMMELRTRLTQADAVNVELARELVRTAQEVQQIGTQHAALEQRVTSMEVELTTLQQTFLTEPFGAKAAEMDVETRLEGVKRRLLQIREELQPPQEQVVGVAVPDGLGDDDPGCPSATMPELHQMQGVGECASLVPRRHASMPVPKFIPPDDRLIAMAEGRLEAGSGTWEPRKYSNSPDEGMKAFIADTVAKEMESALARAKDALREVGAEILEKSIKEKGSKAIAAANASVTCKVDLFQQDLRSPHLTGKEKPTPDIRDSAGESEPDAEGALSASGSSGAARLRRLEDKLQEMETAFRNEAAQPLCSTKGVKQGRLFNGFACFRPSTRA